jgi:hypothetical protein
MERITVKAKVKASVNKVWDLWSDPKHIVKWNAASEEWHTPRAENDLRVGGKFLSRMALMMKWCHKNELPTPLTMAEKWRWILRRKMAKPKSSAFLIRRHKIQPKCSGRVGSPYWTVLNGMQIIYNNIVIKLKGLGQ